MRIKPSCEPSRRSGGLWLRVARTRYEWFLDRGLPIGRRDRPIGPCEALDQRGRTRPTFPEMAAQGARTRSPRTGFELGSTRAVASKGGSGKCGSSRLNAATASVANSEARPSGHRVGAASPCDLHLAAEFDEALVAGGVTRLDRRRYVREADPSKLWTPCRRRRPARATQRPAGPLSSARSPIMS